MQCPDIADNAGTDLADIAGIRGFVACKWYFILNVAW